MEDSSQIEQALKRSEERLRAILDNAYNAFVGMDQHGLITDWNTTAETMFGWTRQEIIGRTLTDTIIPTQYRVAHQRGLEHFLATGVGPVLDRRVELSALRRDGSEFPIEMSIRALRTEGTYAFHAFIADMTERKKTLKAQEHFVAIVLSSNDAIISKDLEGRVTSWNEGAVRLFGYTAEEMLGRSITMLVPRNRQEGDARIERSVDGGRVQHYETVRQRKDGSLVDVSLTLSPIRNEDGEMIGTSKFAHDISERKEKEREARRMEERFQRLLESAPDAMVIVDSEGTIQLANAQAERIFGYTKKEVLYHPVVLLIPANLPGGEAQQNANLARDPKTWKMGHGIELEGQRKDGTTFPIEVTLSPLDVQDGLLISAAIRDITDRKRAENDIRELNRTLEQRVEERTHQLLKSEQRYYNALDSMVDGVTIIGFDWSYLYVNATSIARSTFTREELLGHKVMEKFPGIENTPLFSALERCMSERVPADLESEFQFPSGELLSLELSIQPATDGLFIVSRDVTQEKKADEALRRSEERYHNALDSMMEGIQIIGFDWRYVYVNDAVVAQSTFTREELLGRTMMERYPGIERTPLFATLERCMVERTAQVLENEFHFPNGSMGYFELSVQPMTDGLFILSTDITERKKAAVELSAQREQLERQNKDLEQFAYVASHDLKEPLRMVTNYMELLQLRYATQLDANAQEFIGFAVDGAVRMQQLINDLLLYSQLGRAVATELVDMNTVLEQVRTNLSVAIAESGAMVVSGELPTLRYAPTQLVQVLQNLIANAVKFRRDNVVPEVHITAHLEPGHWRIQVQDNGIGMEEKYKEQVFAPFKRLHSRSKYPGSGIGMAVAQNIVQRHGGRIWFTSTEGVGSTFQFTIKHRS